MTLRDLGVTPAGWTVAVNNVFQLRRGVWGVQFSDGPQRDQTGVRTYRWGEWATPLGQHLAWADPDDTIPSLRHTLDPYHDYGDTVIVLSPEWDWGRTPQALSGLAPGIPASVTKLHNGAAVNVFEGPLEFAWEAAARIADGRPDRFETIAVGRRLRYSPDVEGWGPGIEVVHPVARIGERVYELPDWPALTRRPSATATYWRLAGGSEYPYAEPGWHRWTWDYYGNGSEGDPFIENQTGLQLGVRRSHGLGPNHLVLISWEPSTGSQIVAIDRESGAYRTASLPGGSPTTHILVHSGRALFYARDLDRPFHTRRVEIDLATMAATVVRSEAYSTDTWNKPPAPPSYFTDVPRISIDGRVMVNDDVINLGVGLGQVSPYYTSDRQDADYYSGWDMYDTHLLLQGNHVVVYQGSGQARRARVIEWRPDTDLGIGIHRARGLFS